MAASADIVDVLDRTYHFILSRWAERGHAPHFTDVARALGATPEEGRQRLHDVIAAGLREHPVAGLTMLSGA